LARRTPFSLIRRFFIEFSGDRRRDRTANIEKPHRHRRDFAALHNPLRIAEDYATLDCLSGGSLEFGVGHGFTQGRVAHFRHAARRAAGCFKENSEIILKAWSEPKFSYKGRSYVYENVELLPRPVHTLSHRLDGRHFDRRIIRTCRPQRLSLDADSSFCMRSMSSAKWSSVISARFGRQEQKRAT
jgi:luciferase-like monooxygenase